MEEVVLCRFRETEAVFKWVSSSLSGNCGCHLIMLLSDHATTRAGNPKNVNCGRRGEYSGEWHACPRFRSFPKHLLLVKKYHNTQVLPSDQVCIFLQKSWDCLTYYKTVMVPRPFFWFLYSTTMIKMLAPHCKPCWLTSSHQEGHRSTARKHKELGQRWSPTKGFQNRKVHGLGLGFNGKDKE